MKYKKFHTVQTIQKSNPKIVDRDKIDTLKTDICDHKLSWLGTGSSK